MQFDQLNRRDFITLLGGRRSAGVPDIAAGITDRALATLQPFRGR
jgi:hypothetical protein